jgi:hypothetical protein
VLVFLSRVLQRITWREVTTDPLITSAKSVVHCKPVSIGLAWLSEFVVDLKSESLEVVRTTERNALASSLFFIQP